MPSTHAPTCEGPKHAVWTMEPEQVLKIFNTSQRGLSEDKAAEKLALCGSNSVDTKKQHARLKILLSQFKSPLLLILLGTGILTAFLGEWTETIVILSALFVNTGLGFWQENKAETVLENLKSYFLIRAHVRRNGKEKEISAENVVPGDIIRLSQGERIPADSRLIFVNNLEVDESILTGESLPVSKSLDPVKVGTPLTERSSMLFAGTAVVQGFAEAVVVATGHSSEFGRLARLAQIDSAPTPLQQAVSRFTVKASVVLAILTFLMFLAGLAQGYSFIEMFLISVAVGISAVPESLPVALTVILAVGVERLAKRHGVVKKLLAAESLGSVTLILTDKTGTLTKAEMAFSSAIPFGNPGTDSKTKLFSMAALAAEATIENPTDVPADWRIAGRKIETTILRTAAANHAALPELLEHNQVVDRLPFDSGHKYSAVLLRQTSGDYHVVLMGAPEILLGFTHLTLDQRRLALETIEQRATTGEKILGVISKDLAERPDLRHLNLHGFGFLGFLAFRDPLRDDAKKSIEDLAAAGVRTVIVTGDHAGTAEYIARQLGIWSEGSIMTGPELSETEPESLPELLRGIRVFARVTPEQKLIIAKAFRAAGEVVAVSGDGVNDVPAIKSADIGISLGSGTEAAKSAADLVLLKDDFSTLAASVQEGRKILNNIRKVIVYLLSHSFDELVLIGGTFLLGLPMPLTALQILYVNLFSDSFPAIAFAFEDRRDLPKRRPTLLGRSILDHDMGWIVLTMGIGTSLIMLIIYIIMDWIALPQPLIRSFIFATFGTYTLLSAFSLRSLRKGLFSYNPFGNRKLLGGVGIGLFLTFFAIYFPPVARALELEPLNSTWLTGVIAVSLFNMGIVEISKWGLRSRS